MQKPQGREGTLPLEAKKKRFMASNTSVTSTKHVLYTV